MPVGWGKRAQISPGTELIFVWGRNCSFGCSGETEQRGHSTAVAKDHMNEGLELIKSLFKSEGREKSG